MRGATRPVWSAARGCQGAFGALLAPAALSILSTTFSDPKDRGKAFGVYGAIVGAGGAIGLVLGGILTEYLSWRWCLYVNLLFAGLAVMGAVLLLKHQRARTRARLDLPGVALVSASMFCLVYGFSNAASHSWHTPSTFGFLAAGVALLAGFAFWQSRAASPLLPPRVVLDRNRGRPYLRGAITGLGTFLGGTLHRLPFLIPQYRAAVLLALAAMAFELLALAWIRRRFFGTGFLRSFISITLGGAIIVTVGAALGAVS